MAKNVIETILRIIGETDDAESGVDRLADKMDDLKKKEKEVRDETKKVGDELEKTGAKGEILERLDSITGGWATKVVDAAGGIRKMNLALKGTRTALLATGIGAAVVAIGLLIEGVSQLRSRYQRMTQANNEYRDALVQTSGTVAKFMTDLMTVESSLDLARKGIISKEKALNTYNEKLGETVGYAGDINEAEQLMADNTDKVIKSIQLRAQAEFLLARAAEIRAKVLAGDEEVLENNFSTWDAFKNGFKTFVKSGFTDVAGATVAGTVGEIAEATNEVQILADDLEGKAKTLLQQAAEIKNTQTPGIDPNAGPARRPTVTPVSTLESEGAILGKITDINAKSAEDINGIWERNAEAQRIRQQILRDQILAINADTFGKLATVVGENTKTGKVLAAAQALINGYLGITQVLATPSTLPEPFATINKIANAAVIFKTALKAVQDINNVDVPGGGAARSSGGGRGNVPSFNLVGGSGQNQIIDTLNRDQEPPKAIVVSREMTTQQEVDRNTQRNASL